MLNNFNEIGELVQPIEQEISKPIGSEAGVLFSEKQLKLGKLFLRSLSDVPITSSFYCHDITIKNWFKYLAIAL